jgi:hypothetical protein
MSKDYRETLQPHERQAYDAQMDAQIHAKRLERPDRRPPKRDVLQHLNETMDRMDREYYWKDGTLVKKVGNAVCPET